MAAFTPHHLPISREHVAGNGPHGRLFFLPGSDGRARRMAQRFTHHELVPSDRQLNVYLGQVHNEQRPVDVAAVSTGMGCASLNIVMSELILLGARLFVRVGTSGSLRPDVVRAGSLVIATAAVRDEGTSDRYVARDYPAVGDREVAAALERAAQRLGYGDRTYRGVVHAKDSLYGIEFGHGPRKRTNEQYLEQLRRMRVLASDMETSHLFVLGDVHSTEIVPIGQHPSPTGIVRTGAVLAVVGDDAPYASADVIAQCEEDAIQVALEGAFELFGSALLRA